MTIPSFETQLSFINYEMGTGDGGNVAGAFRNNPNMTFAEASTAFERKYERPAAGSTNARIENSRRIFNAGGVGISPRADQAYSYFRSQGWSPAQASGIVGNLIHESGSDSLPSNARNPGDGTDGSDSIGIAQWNSTRAQNLLNWDGTAIIPSEDFVPDPENDVLPNEVEIVDSPESAAEAVTGEESVGFGQSYYQDNVLNEFDSYTYNWAIHMIHPQTAQKMEDNITDGTFVTLAQTGVENELSIEAVTHQITTTFDRGNFREAAGNSFQITLQEANGFTYFNRIKKACQRLEVQSVTDIVLLLELNFRGWNQDGSTIPAGNNQQSSLGPFYYNCVVSKVDVKHEVGISTYTLSLQGLPSKAFNRMVLYFKSEVIVEASTFGEFLEELQTDYNKQVRKQTNDSPGVVVPDEYYFECEDEDWKNWKFDIPDPEAARNITSSSASGLTQFKFPKGSSMSDAIAQVLMHTREFKRLPTANSGFAKEMPDEMPEAGKMADLLNWFTFKTDVTFGVFDQDAQKYQQKFTYKIAPYITPEAVHDTTSYTELYTDKVKGTKRLNKILSNGLMKKRYDYTYTGLNTEIYNLDMTFNNSYFVLQAMNSGILTDSSGYVGGQGEVVESKNNAAQIKRDLARINSDIDDANEKIAALQMEGASWYGTFGGLERKRWDALEQVEQQKLDDLEFLRGSMEKSLEIVNTITEKAVQKVLDQGVGVTNLDKPKKQYITQTDLYSKNSLTSTLEDRKTELTFNYKTPEGALAVDGSDNSTNIGSAMLGALELNLLATSDMTEIDMQVRGDLYWLGRPQGSLANNSGQANYDLGGLGFFLNARFPTYEDESGLSKEITDFQMTSVYRVTSVQASYMSGEFKMLLQAFRDPMINASQLYDQLDKGKEVG